MSNIKITINKAKSIIHKIVESNTKKFLASEPIKHAPIFLHSSPGIGKSSMIRQVVEELSTKKDPMGYVDVRLSQMEQSDVAGIPYVSHAGLETESMNISVPMWFPSAKRIADGDFPKRGILFLDELSNAAIGVQHAAYGVVLDREVHGIKLGEGWQIIAAGNLKTDKTGAKAVAPALANRFGTHLEIRSDVDDFIAYAVRHKFSPQIIGFISFKPDALYRFDPSKAELAFATPRSWEQFDNLLKVGLANDEATAVLAGCLGDGTAHEFNSYQKYYQHLPNFEKIMDGEEIYKIKKKDAGIMFAVASSVLVCLIENHNKPQRIKNLVPVMEQLGDDVLIMIYKSLKNGAPIDTISEILSQTYQVYKRIATYTNMDTE